CINTPRTPSSSSRFWPRTSSSRSPFSRRCSRRLRFRCAPPASTCSTTS
ncbi:MAG: putative membrane protein, partial [uncultured Microvirga sp.]